MRSGRVGTSLKTVFAGFLVASLVAIPLGVLCGISPGIQAALNPLIQIFKPVSPLAWLPIVMICVGALYTTPPAEAWFEKSFLSSALTVALCSLWPTLANTALGVASVDRDHLNVARVLRLGTWTRVRKIVIPSALPMIFAGLYGGMLADAVDRRRLLITLSRVDDRWLVDAISYP